MKVIRFIRGYVDYMYCSWKKEKELWNNRSLIDYDTYEITSSCGDITQLDITFMEIDLNST